METAVIIKKEKIYLVLEYIRKLGLEVYVSSWANNFNEDFILILRNYKTFDMVLEDVSQHTERSLKDDFNIVSIPKFKIILKKEWIN